MKILFCSEGGAKAKVAVLVSLYNYEKYICEALDSVAAQTLENIELIVCNDCSTDNSVAVVMEWIRKNERRFSRLALIENDVNSGLSATRNASIAYSAAPYVFILDADNMIYPACLERSLEILEESEPEAAFAYTQREMFDETDPNGNTLENLQDWDASLFSCGNYIDAMVMHKKQSIQSVGCYTGGSCFGRLGWEDFELWLKYIRAKFYGIKIHQPLIRYRYHKESMLRTTTNKLKNSEILWKNLYERYPEIISKEPLLQLRVMNGITRLGFAEKSLRQVEDFIRKTPVLFRMAKACKKALRRMLGN